MPESNQERRRKLQALLRKRGKALSPEAARLANALWNDAGDAPAHRECLDRLPEYVRDEVNDEPVADLYPAVKQHLDRCDVCFAEYAALLETVLADDRDDLPQPAGKPHFDLSFLPPLRQPEPPLDRRVAEWWETLKAQLRGLVLMPDVVLSYARAKSIEPVVAQGQTQDGSVRWRIVEDAAQSLTIRIGSHEPALEGARIRLMAGEWRRETVLTRMAPDPVGAEIVLTHDERPRDTQGQEIPLTIELIDPAKG